MSHGIPFFSNFTTTESNYSSCIQVHWRTSKTVYGIYPWVIALAMGNLIVRRFWVGCGWFFFGGEGKGKRKLRVRSRPAWLFFCWTTRVSKQPFLCYIEQWGLHCIMCQTIVNGAPDPRCPGQTCTWFKFRQLDDLFHTLKTVKGLMHLVPPRTPRSSEYWMTEF